MKEKGEDNAHTEPQNWFNLEKVHLFIPYLSHSILSNLTTYCACVCYVICDMCDVWCDV